MRKLFGTFIIIAISLSLIITFSIKQVNAEEVNGGSVHGNISTIITFNQSQSTEVKDWFSESIEGAVNPELEPALEEAKQEGDVVKAEAIESAINEIQDSGSDSLFTQEGTATTLKANLPDVFVSFGNISTKTDANGNFDLNGIPEGEYLVTISKDGSVIYSQPVDIKQGDQQIDLELNVSGDAFYEGAEQMIEGNTTVEETAQASTTYYSTKPIGSYVGSKLGKMKIIANNNIVNCNKADDSISDSQYFPANGSDCSVAIARGAAYASNPIVFFYWKKNLVCYIESIQSAANMLGDNAGQNVYCNAKKKSDGHYNCSWFRDHSESLHTH